MIKKRATIIIEGIATIIYKHTLMIVL